VERKAMVKATVHVAVVLGRCNHKSELQRCSKGKGKGKGHSITGHKRAQRLRMSRAIPLLILNLGARCGGWSAPRLGHFTPGKDPVPIVQEAGWDPGLVWTCAKNLAPTGI
jgi:hypothetical protein